MSKVLVIYTGGTIGMFPYNETHPVFVNKRNEFLKRVKNMPELNDKSVKLKMIRNKTTEDTTLILPVEPESTHRIVYTIIEWEDILDSTNANSEVWIDVAKNIQDNYHDYDGFVVLHGTDTLAYTSSILSFMLENLQKTVVVTGSQVPMFSDNSDGLSNFLGALTIAGSLVLPQVVVFFDNKLFKGNRVMKVHSLDFNAFDSPNHLPLYDFNDDGIKLRNFPRCETKQNRKDELEVNLDLKDVVALVKLYPTMSVDVLRETLKEPIEGVVIESFGAGNMPKAREDLMEVIKEATDRGVIVINVSQCQSGGVKAIYETGELDKFGVISGRDMTSIAAFTKLMYVVSKDWDLEAKKQAMSENLRGEMTVKEPENY